MAKEGLSVLVFTHRVPFLQNSGYAIVSYNTIKGLVEEGHRVTVISLNADNSLLKKLNDPLLEKITFKTFPISLQATPRNFVRALLADNLFTNERFFSPTADRSLAAELKQTDYDIIHLEGLPVTTYLATIRKNSKAKVIYRSHTTEHQVWKRMAKQIRNPLRKWYLTRFARKMELFETEHINHFDGVAAITDFDRKIFEQLGCSAPIEVLPAAVNMDKYKPDPSRTEPNSLFFLGSLDWLPNREGLEWFLENFHEEITNGELRSKLYVAGHDVPEEFDRYENNREIFIVGEVDSALEFINNKSIMVVPLLSGGGMRIKIIEGMAMGKCIISTTIGAEGIQYEDGKHLFIANTKEEFHEAIKRCLNDEKLCRTTGKNARDLVSAQHDYRVLATKLSSFYRAVLPV
ncbi:MAG: glycosyltransferase family 4 protein [Mucilaginibacter polytrichastri]|nr:glycosyltransferase family 4 protein [Mucilaginibacter polytrichastri]